MHKIMFLFVALMLSIASNLFAGEIYVLDKKTSREYLVVTPKIENGFKVDLYSQEKGDYQDLVFTTNINNRSEVKKFIQNKYSNFNKVSELEFWDIETLVSDGLTSQLRSLFGKRHSAIWYAKNKWDENWEKEFSNWIQNEVNEDFYIKYNISTDCADAVVGLRWIFSRINSLPVANTLSDTRVLFSNSSILKDWRKLPTAKNWHEDRLFLTALNYVMNLTSTRTIIYDGYPVSLDSKGFVPGVFIVTQNEGGGHVKFISETHVDSSSELPFYTLSSTVPRKLRNLNKEVMLDQDWPEYKVKDILAFKWPVVRNGRLALSSSEDRANYSNDQYDLSIKAENPIFIEYILKNLDGEFNPFKMIQLGAQDLVRYLQNRVVVVNQGFEECRQISCDLDSAGDQTWGTRNRDENVIKKFNNLEVLVREFSKIHPSLNKSWVDLLKSTFIQVNEHELNLFVVKYIFDEKMYSSLASDSIEKRWGLDVSERVKIWSAEIVKLLDKRNEVLSNTDYTCDDQCAPRDGRWLTLSTYHLDKELNANFVKIRNFCHMFGERLCQRIIGRIDFSKNYNNQTKDLIEWINMIPFFNSDPKASIDARWGKHAANVTLRLLPVHEKEVIIADNQIALIDYDNLYDLRAEKSIYRARANEDLYLDKTGAALRVDNNNSSFSIFQNGQWVAADVLNSKFSNTENLNIKAHNNAYIIEDFEDGIATIYLYSNSKLELVGVASYSYKIKNDLFYYVDHDKEASLIVYDLKKNVRNEVNFTGVKQLKNIELLEIESVHEDKVVFKYEDKDEDLYLAFFASLNNKTLEVFPGKYKVLWGDARLEKMVIQTDWNREFPKIYAVSKSGADFKSEALYNDAYAFNVINEAVYFISVEGGQWDQNKKKLLYKWSEQAFDLIQYSDSYRPVSNISNGYYFHTQSGGIIHDLKSDNVTLAPGAMMLGNSFCSSEIMSINFTSYRYDTSYGDYNCMGGLIDKRHGLYSDKYLSPVLTIYPWINDKDLVDKQWLRNFHSSVVYKGSLVSFGLNNSYWVDIAE